MKKITVIQTFALIFISLSINAQIITEGPSAQFLYPDFESGKVKMRNGQMHDLILNYNTISEKMVYQKEGKLFDLMSYELTDTIYLQGSKFVPVGKSFYQALLLASITFFVQYKGELLPPGAPAGYGVNSQVSNTKLWSSFESSQGYYNLELPSDYKVETDLIYWLRKDKEMISFINERQFLKISPDKETELKKFIKENRIKFDKPEDVTRLAKFFNSLYQDISILK